MDKTFEHYLLIFELCCDLSMGPAGHMLENGGLAVGLETGLWPCLDCIVVGRGIQAGLQIQISQVWSDPKKNVDLATPNRFLIFCCSFFLHYVFYAQEVQSNLVLSVQEVIPHFI